MSHWSQTAILATPMDDDMQGNHLAEPIVLVENFRAMFYVYPHTATSTRVKHAQHL